MTIKLLGSNIVRCELRVDSTYVSYHHEVGLCAEAIFKEIVLRPGQSILIGCGDDGTLSVSLHDGQLETE